MIVGPHEYVGRIPWWLRRIAAGGRVLAPGTPDWPIQPIDVRDVAAFTLHAAEYHLSGPYTLAAPIGSATFGDLLETCEQVTGSTATVEWVDHDFLIAQQVTEWTELPLWRPYPGIWRIDAARTRAAGPTCRPLDACHHHRRPARAVTPRPGQAPAPRPGEEGHPRRRPAPQARAHRPGDGEPEPRHVFGVSRGRGSVPGSAGRP
ncbi:hypothetical protein [Microbispora sp. NPDC046933]|uniref:hypothetical protein n=1 Tax=Microbispora sp. NPDC046933 TaxID=3155618 RepID=UPI003410506C